MVRTSLCFLTAVAIFAHFLVGIAAYRSLRAFGRDRPLRCSPPAYSSLTFNSCGGCKECKDGQHLLGVHLPPVTLAGRAILLVRGKAQRRLLAVWGRGCSTGGSCDASIKPRVRSVNGKIPQYARRATHVRGSVATLASCPRMLRTLHSYPPPQGTASRSNRAPSGTGTGLIADEPPIKSCLCAHTYVPAPTRERTGDMTREPGGAARVRWSSQRFARHVREGARWDMTPCMMRKLQPDALLGKIGGSEGVENVR